MRSAPWLLVTITACSAGPEATGRPAAEVVAVPDREALRELEPGTLLRLAPSTVVAAADFDSIVVDGLLREALRQSPHFDVAGGAEDCASRFEVRTAIDPSARQIACSLVEAGGAPLPLASAGFADRPVHDAIDEVAAAVRTVLGETIEVAPRKCAQIYSADARAIAATERGLLRGSRPELAIPTLRSALQRDPGCTVTIAALLPIELRAVDPEAIARRAAETLEHLRTRCSPTTQHKLLRLVWLARAAYSNPAETDLGLLQAGEVASAERPHDPHPRYTMALALNYLGRFDESAPLLEQLRDRWPSQPWVGYHLAFALTATGRAEDAAAVIRGVAPQLAPGDTMFPRVIALFHAGRHDELTELLDDLIESSLIRSSTHGEHALLRIRAAHAVLREDRAGARDELLADIEWLRQRPSLIDRYAFDLAEAGEVLVHLGFHRELGVRLEALEELRGLGPTLSNALTYLGGLVLVHDSDLDPGAAVRALRGDDRAVWSSVLEAAVHRRNGEIIRETQALSVAVRSTDSALVHASFARALRTMGRTEDSQRLLAELRGQLLRIDLRHPTRHALMSPGRALALLATK